MYAHIPRFFRILPVLAGLFLFSACEDSTTENISDDELHGRSPTDTVAFDPYRTNSVQSATASEADQPEEAHGKTDPSGGGSVGNTSGDIGAIVWTGKNVSSWPVTTTLRASVSGSTIRLNYGKSLVWPASGDVNANAWAIVNIGGTWYAGTFEYLRPGQTSKPSYTLNGSHGDHFKVSPLSSWHPQSGEVFGLMVSGLCRGGLANVQERSDICLVRWP